MGTDFDRDAFVDAYFGYFRTKDDSLFWSWEVFYGDWADCTEMLELVLLLVATAPDEPSLSLVGAGPLEDLLWKCGDAVIDRIELAAGGDTKLGRALANVWGLERAIEARVNRLLDGQETLPDEVNGG